MGNERIKTTRPVNLQSQLRELHGTAEASFTVCENIGPRLSQVQLPQIDKTSISRPARPICWNWDTLEQIGKDEIDSPGHDDANQDRWEDPKCIPHKDLDDPIQQSEPFLVRVHNLFSV